MNSFTPLKPGHLRINHKHCRLAHDQVIRVDGRIVDSVCSPLAVVEVDVSRCSHLKNLKLGDAFPRKSGAVYLLVGTDQYYKLI